MQVSCGLKQVEIVEEHGYVRGWAVTFGVVVTGAPDFAVPVFVSIQDADDKTLVAVAYQRLHEVVSSLEKILGSPP